MIFKHKKTAVIAACALFVCLGACGRSVDSVLEDSAPKPIDEFGGQVSFEPTTEPSQIVMPIVSPGSTEPAPAPSGGGIGGGDYPAPSPVKPSAAPSGGGTTPSTSPSPSSSPSGSPTNTPSASQNPEAPLGPSEASSEDAKVYIGKPLSALINGLGYPLRSDYELIDEDDPAKGEKGTIYYISFIVTTKRDASGEIITGVTPVIEQLS